jgi:DHA1 family multidrug resistance protein-like MFS transporter
MINWRKNLALLWICQVLSRMGFSFALPFTPLYIQAMGITDPEALRLWSGLLMAGSGVLFAMGLVRSPELPLVLRLAQGASTGTSITLCLAFL